MEFEMKHRPSRPKGTREIRAMSARTLRQLRTSALSLAVFDGTQVLASHTTGVQCVGSHRRVPPTSAWHLGSCTKAMTAVLFARLVQQSVVRFETTIGEVFDRKEIHPAFREVTVSQLLRHVGGTTGDLQATHPGVWREMEQAGSRDSKTVRHDAVLRVLFGPPSQAAGTFAYSNAGYCVVGSIIEQLTGRSWEALMKTELFDPLSMSSAGFGAPTGDSPWPHLYQPDGVAFVPVDPALPEADNPPAIGPAGTVHASILDWVRFLQVFLEGGPPGYLRPSTLAELLRSDNGIYAAGWGVAQDRLTGKTLTHAGSNTMSFAVTWLCVEKHHGVAMATNGFNDETQEGIAGLGRQILVPYVQ